MKMQASHVALSLSHVGLFCGIGIVNLRQMA